MSGAWLAIDDVVHRYGALEVLGGIHLQLEPGSHLAITGSSGAGKTTLLSLIGGLDRVQSGRITVDGRDLGTLDARGLAAYRRARVGFVFQHFGLIDALTARENVELVMALSGMSPRARRDRARELLYQVGLGKRTEHRVTALSGGEKQRVAIARALANGPGLVLADEPTGNLDEDTAGLVLDLLETLRNQTGCTLVTVTHDAAVAARADRRVRLSRGRLAGVAA